MRAVLLIDEYDVYVAVGKVMQRIGYCVSLDDFMT
jgi:hypothetical protein